MTTFRLGDRVRAVVGRDYLTGEVTAAGPVVGTVVEVRSVPGREGDAVYVRWDTGYTGRKRAYGLVQEDTLKPVK